MLAFNPYAPIRVDLWESAPAFRVAMAGSFSVRQGMALRARRSVRRWLCLGAMLAVFSSVAQAASVAISPTMAVTMTREDGPQNVRVGFFNEANGWRVGRLQIGKMTLDYRHQGVFRVAWKPQVVLTGVTLQIADRSSCAAVSSQLPEALRSIGAGGAMVMREVVLEIQAPAHLRIESARAELTAAGDLLLRDAHRSDAPDASACDVVLYLSGARIGEIEAAAANPISHSPTTPNLVTGNP